MTDPGTTPVALVHAVATPWATVHLAVTERGLAALELLSPPDVFVEQLERRLGRPVRQVRDAADDPTGWLVRVVAAVRAFLDGDPEPLAAIPLDLDGLRPWDRLVLGAVRAIPWGSTAGYGEVARRIGRAGAARAVGGAVGRNPVGLAIPCHRVIAGDGTLGGYGGGWWGSREVLLDVKRRLLAVEGVRVRDSAQARARR